MPAPKIAVDIRDYLVNTSLISPVTVDMLAPTPVLQYAVMEYSGPPNVKTHGGASPGGVALDEAVLQIMARAASKQAARDNIHSVVDALDGLRDVTINSTSYSFIRGISRPRFLIAEEGGANIFVWEIMVTARR